MYNNGESSKKGYADGVHIHISHAIIIVTFKLSHVEGNEEKKVKVCCAKKRTS